jgi:hypothetical protein
MDLQTITAFLSQYGTWGLLLAGVLTITSDKWLPLIKGLKFKAAEVPSDEVDTLDLLALKRLQARALRSGNKEFQTELRDVEVCFFNPADPPNAEPAK